MNTRSYFILTFSSLVFHEWFIGSQALAVLRTLSWKNKVSLNYENCWNKKSCTCAQKSYSLFPFSFKASRLICSSVWSKLKALWAAMSPLTISLLEVEIFASWIKFNKPLRVTNRCSLIGKSSFSSRVFNEFIISLRFIYFLISRMFWVLHKFLNSFILL